MAEAEAEAAGPEAAGDGAAVIGATVPTGFEATAAAEVQEKLGSASRISRDRGKIYFEVPARCLPEVRAPTPGPPRHPGAVPAGCGHRRCVGPAEPRPQRSALGLPPAAGQRPSCLGRFVRVCRALTKAAEVRQTRAGFPYCFRA